MSGQRLIVIACLAEVACMTGFAGFPTLLPDFLDLWQLSTTEAGWINGIYFAAYTVAVAVLVSLTDRVDPRLIYLGSAAIAALSSLGFAVFADGFWTAMIFRALGGAGLAGTYMPGLKALTDHLEEAQQARGVAFYTATFSIGTAASFLLIGEVSTAWGWRAAFAVAGLGPLVAAAMMIFLMPASRAHQQHPPQHRLLDFRPVLANRQALAYILAYTAHNWELFVLRSWIVAFLVFAQGLQPAGGLGAAWNLPAIAAAVNLVGLPSSVLGNEAAQRFGRRRVVIAVMSLSALLACTLGFTASLPLVLVVALCFLYNVTVTGDSASITAGAVAAARPGQRGATMAVHSLIGFAGAFVGPLAFGVVLDLTGDGASLLSWGLAFASAGLAVACGPLVLLGLARKD